MTEAIDRFDRDTAIEHVEGGTYSTRIDPGWWVIRGPNGGYIAAIIQRAISAAVGEPDRTPRSLTVHYTSPPVEGEALVQTQIERRGGSLTTVSARLTQQGKLRALAIGACSTARDSHEFFRIEMPKAPDPASLPVSEKRIPMNERYDHRYVPGMAPNVGSEEATIAAWIRLDQPHAVDHPLLAAYADALPPAVFAQATETGFFGALPTVDLTVHYRRDPSQLGIAPDDYCLAVFRSRLAHGGYIEEDGEIWSPSGDLLVQSRQLAVILGESGG